MPAKPDGNLDLQIGHVLFIDIVGYSKLLIEEQKEQLNQLTQIVLATAPVRETTNEQLVRLPTGDGMALVSGAASKSRRAARLKSPRPCRGILSFPSAWAFTAGQLAR